MRAPIGIGLGLSWLDATALQDTVLADIAFVAAGTKGAAALGGDVVPGLPAGLAENDYMVCAVVTNDVVGTPPTMSGWTTLLAATGANGAGGIVTLTVFGKNAGASESAPTVVYGGALGIIAGICAWRGVDTTTPIDATGAAQANSNSNTTVTCPALTSVTDKATVVMVAASAGYGTFSAQSGTPTPSERFDAAAATGVSPPALCLADFVITPAGTSSSRTMTLSGGSARVGVQIALRPALV